MENLDKFLSWAKTEKDLKARRDLERLINGCIDKAKKEMECVEYTRIETEQFLGHDEQKLEDWIASHVMNTKVVGSGTEAYWNAFVQMMDYIANPGIIKKSSLLLNEFMSNHLQYLQENEGRITYIKKRVDKHIRKCYDISKSHQSKYKLNPSIAVFFQN